MKRTLVISLALFVWLGITALCVAFAADADFSKDFQSARTPPELEALLKKYPDRADEIVPRLERILVEAVNSEGPWGRLFVKFQASRPAANEKSGSVTHKAGATGEMLVKEFPGDAYTTGFALALGGTRPTPRALYGPNSVHRYDGKVEMWGLQVTFIGEGDRLNRLTFVVYQDSGLFYLRGKGRVQFQEGREVQLPE